MKKVLILQNNGKTLGGVWQVNKLIGEELIKNGYDVYIVSVRNNKNDLVIEHDKRLKVLTINENDLWGSYKKNDLFNELKRFNIIGSIKIIFSKIKYDISLNKDKRKLKKYIIGLEPNYIINSHYEVLPMIPKKYLSRVINLQHSSFSEFGHNKKNMNTFFKFNHKIKFLWLSKNIMDKVSKVGIVNNSYIYNAVRIRSDKCSDVVNNKRLITISRLSDKQKNIGVMISIVDEIFKDNRFDDWELLLFGEYDKEMCKNVKSNRIRFMGVTNEPKREYLDASINLNTSLFEGFSMSILEAQECGVPTISFNYWESVYEQIINGKTGLIVKDKDEFITSLKELMLDSKKLVEMSKCAKDYSKKFYIENIINEWRKLFDEIDEKVNK